MIRSKLLTGAALFLLAPVFFAADEGQPAGGNGPSIQERIKSAVDQLDPANDAHWTESGKPAMAAVEKIVGENVSRAELNAVVGDLRRPEGEQMTGAGPGEQLAADRPLDIDPAERGDDAAETAAPDPRSMDRAERERLANIRSRAAESRSNAARTGDAGVTAEEMSRRAAVKETLGEDDDRVDALSANRADVVAGRLSRLRTREERIRQADRSRIAGRAEHIQNSRIAAERGAVEAPDFVSGRDIKVLDRYYLYGRFYEKGEIVKAFVGRMPLKAVFA